jgi:hypothetical protein
MTTDEAICRAVGEEIRLARETLGANRTELVALIPSGLSAQGLANYEYGIRHCSIVRFVQICEALNTPAMDLLGLALQRAELDLYRNNIQVDLKALANYKHNDLTPLRSWARHRLDQDVDGSGTARLGQTTIAELAILHGMDRVEFIRRLLAFTPSVAPRWLWPGTDRIQP